MYLLIAFLVFFCDEVYLILSPWKSKKIKFVRLHSLRRFYKSKHHVECNWRVLCCWSISKHYINVRLGSKPQHKALPITLQKMISPHCLISGENEVLWNCIDWCAQHWKYIWEYFPLGPILMFKRIFHPLHFIRRIKERSYFDSLQILIIFVDPLPRVCWTRMCLDSKLYNIWWGWHELGIQPCQWYQKVGKLFGVASIGHLKGSPAAAQNGRRTVMVMALPLTNLRRSTMAG